MGLAFKVGDIISFSGTSHYGEVCMLYQVFRDDNDWYDLIILDADPVGIAPDMSLGLRFTESKDRTETYCTLEFESIPEIHLCTCDFHEVIMKVGCQCDGN